MPRASTITMPDLNDFLIKKSCTYNTHLLLGVFTIERFERKLAQESFSACRSAMRGEVHLVFPLVH